MTKSNRYTVVNAIKEMIINGTLSPGMKLEATSEIAERYCVALATAQAALKQLTEEGLISRIPGKGTYISKSKASNQSSKDVLIIGSTKDAYWLELYFKIIVELKKDGINSQCIDVNTERAELRDILKAGYMMIILSDHRVANLIQTEFPDQKIISLSASKPFRFRGHVVCSNPYATAYDGTKYLIEKGHKQIACLCNAGKSDLDSDIRHFLGNDLIAGYYRALTEHDLSPMLMSFSSGGKAEEIVHTFLKAGKIPTAVFSSLDHRSKEFLEIIDVYDLKVPDDIALVSTGNSVWSDAFKFTSFDLQRDKMAGSCVEIIKAAQRGKIQQDEYICRHITPKLIVRESCGE